MLSKKIVLNTCDMPDIFLSWTWNEGQKTFFEYKLPISDNLFLIHFTPCLSEVSSVIVTTRNVQEVHAAYLCSFTCLYHPGVFLPHRVHRNSRSHYSLLRFFQLHTKSWLQSPAHFFCKVLYVNRWLLQEVQIHDSKIRSRRRRKW